MEQEIKDSLNGAVLPDVAVKSKISYAPPTFLRVMRVVIGSLSSIMIVALFTWIYVTSNDRANDIDLEQYLTDRYVVSEPSVPVLPLDERVETNFNPPADLSEAALQDLKNFEYAVAEQFSGMELSVRREANIIYFTVEAGEYTLELSSEESYPYLDEFLN